MTIMAKKSKLQQFVEASLAAIKGPRKGRPVADVFDLDADSAAWALSTTLGNRDPRQSHIERLRVAMKSDESWNFDGDAISFAIDEHDKPRLFEGHHRCEARALMVGSAFDPLVTITIGSRKAAQETRGDKQKWTPRDHATANGWPARCGEVASSLLRAAVGHFGGTEGTEINAVGSVCPEGLRYLGEAALAHSRLANSNVLGGMLLAWPSNPAKVREFADLYFAGQFGKEHPVGALRQWARDHGKDAGRGSSERIRLVYRAASAVGLYLRGEARDQLKLDGKALTKMVEHWRALEPALGAKLTVPTDWIRDHTTKKGDAE